MLREIELHRSVLDATGLENLLAMCPSLEVLDVTLGGAIVGMCDLNYEIMGQSLTTRGRHIHTLRMDMRFCEAFETSGMTLGDIRGMSSLQHLLVDRWVLFGQKEHSTNSDSDDLVASLPKSLKSRAVDNADGQDYVEDDDQRLHEVISSCQFTQLDSIRVQRGAAFAADLGGTVWQGTIALKGGGEVWQQRPWLTLTREAANARK